MGLPELSPGRGEEFFLPVRFKETVNEKTQELLLGLHPMSPAYSRCQFYLSTVPQPNQTTIFPEHPRRSAVPTLSFGLQSSLTSLPTLYFLMLLLALEGCLYLSDLSFSFKLLEGKNYVLCISVSHASYIIVFSTCRHLEKIIE